MHIVEPVYCTVQLCAITHKLSQTLIDIYEKKAALAQIDLILCLFNLWMKEMDFLKAHLNMYVEIILQLSF